MLPSLSPAHNTLARHWLLLGIGALALAGVFSILLVLLRTPSIQAIIPYHDFFQTALIVHVDLSVLVWMLAMSAMLWSMIQPSSLLFVGRTAFGIALAGTLCIALSPFIGTSSPLLNNYIPVLQNPLFFLGLSLFGCGILFQATITTLHLPTRELPFAIYCSAMITIVALICFTLSYFNLRHYIHASTTTTPLQIQHFYELLFWGGGHILQFTYTQGMMISWLILATAIGTVLPANMLKLLLAINLIAVLPMPFILYNFSIDSSEYLTYFTDHMRYVGGIAPLLATLLLLGCWWKKRVSVKSPEGAALLCSLLLFTVGGVLAHMIRGANVTIPAHYHGSIVGVTLAFMGLAYVMLPRLGFGKVEGRLAVLQPYIYAGGQFLHVSGLAWSGGYGALRKTPGEVLSIQAKAGMGLMGLGGLIAIIGGILFVVVAVRAIRNIHAIPQAPSEMP
jgi:cytochrome c oxidase subunit 1